VEALAAHRQLLWTVTSHRRSILSERANTKRGLISLNWIKAEVVSCIRISIRLLGEFLQHLQQVAREEGGGVGEKAR
ncbi:uncharacterized protein METZ01_LOCUS462297, partial [marine metagenome]